MALATIVTGNGKLISRDDTSRRYSVEDADSPGDVVTWVEDVTREVREWYALTRQAAEDECAAAVQPADGGKYSYSMALQNKVTGAYTLTRTYELKVTVVADQPQCVTPVFDPDGGAFGAGTESVTITTTTLRAKIKWAKLVGGSLSAWAEINSGDTVSMDVPGTIYAYAFRTGFDISDTASATFTETA